MALITRLLGDDHPYVAEAAARVGLNLSGQGKYAEAAGLYRKALEIRRRALGEENPRTASSYDSLGAVLHYQGKYAEAEPLLKKALEIARRLLGDGHVDTAVTLYNLGDLEPEAGFRRHTFRARNPREWELKAELVTLSACETALGRQAGGEGFVGFTQALSMSGTRSVCLSLWKVDDTATALLMQRFYANLLGRREGLKGPMVKAEALREAKAWLRGLGRGKLLTLAAELSGGTERGKGAKARQSADFTAAIPIGGNDDRPYAHSYYWAAFVLSGDAD